MTEAVLARGWIELNADDTKAEASVQHFGDKVKALGRQIETGFYGRQQAAARKYQMELDRLNIKAANLNRTLQHGRIGGSLMNFGAGVNRFMERTAGANRMALGAGAAATGGLYAAAASNPYAMDLLSKSASLAGQALMRPFLPAVVMVSGWLQKLANTVNELTEKHPILTKAIVAATVALGALATAGLVASGARAVGGMIGAGASILGGAVGGGAAAGRWGWGAVKGWLGWGGKAGGAVAAGAVGAEVGAVAAGAGAAGAGAAAAAGAGKAAAKGGAMAAGKVALKAGARVLPGVGVAITAWDVGSWLYDKVTGPPGPPVWEWGKQQPAAPARKPAGGGGGGGGGILAPVLPGSGQYFGAAEYRDAFQTAGLQNGALEAQLMIEELKGIKIVLQEIKAANAGVGDAAKQAPIAPIQAGV